MIQFTPLSEQTQVLQETNGLQDQMAQLQSEEATNQQYTEPDQAPETVVASMTLSEGLAQASWDTQNLNTASEVLATTNGALENMVTLVNQASALAVQASDPTDQVPGGLGAMATTAEGYVQQFVALLNTQANGVSIFAGADPFRPVTQGNAVVNVPAPGSTAWVWQLPVESGVQVPVTANGYEPGIAPGSTSVFQNALGALQGLVQAIQTQTPATVEAALSSVATQLNTLTTYMGAQQQNITTYTQQVATTSTALQVDLTANDGVNLPEVLSQITADTTAYQAALQSTGALLQMSLWNDLTFH